MTPPDRPINFPAGERDSAMSTSVVDAPNAHATDPDTPSERALYICRQTGLICGLITAIIGTLTLSNNVFEFFTKSQNRFLGILTGRFRDTDTETAVTTGLAFLLCGTALALLARRPRGSVQLALVRGAGWLVALWSIYVLPARPIYSLTAGR